MKKVIIIFVTYFLIYSCAVFAQSQKKIAVLPFANLMKDDSLEWLTGGISSTITTKLGNVKGLYLVERSQIENALKELSFQGSGFVDEKTAKDVGKLLGVDVIVVGEFQKAGNTLRITARFVEVQTGKIISPADATGKFDDIFKLQDDIAFALLKSLGVDTSSGEIVKQITNNPTENFTAFEWSQKGYDAMQAKNYDKAMEYFGKSIEADNNYAYPYSQRGICYYYKQNYSLSLADYSKAIELNSSDATTFNNRGLTYYQLGDYGSAISDYTQAIKLNPQYASAYYNRGYCYNEKKLYDETISDYTKAIELNPQDSGAYYNRGIAYYWGKGYKDQCIEDWKKAADLGHPDAKINLKKYFEVDY